MGRDPQHTRPNSPNISAPNVRVRAEMRTAVKIFDFIPHPNVFLILVAALGRHAWLNVEPC